MPKIGLNPIDAMEFLFFCHTARPIKNVRRMLANRRQTVENITAQGKPYGGVPRPIGCHFSQKYSDKNRSFPRKD